MCTSSIAKMILAYMLECQSLQNERELLILHSHQEGIEMFRIVNVVSPIYCYPRKLSILTFGFYYFLDIDFTVQFQTKSGSLRQKTMVG